MRRMRGEHTKYDKLIQTDREAFRAEAMAALHAFDIADRTIASSMETGNTTMVDLLKAWYEQLQPLLSDLEKERTSRRFRTMIGHHLQVDEPRAQEAIDTMIQNRKLELVSGVIDRLYDGEPHSEQARQAACTFFAQPSDYINTFTERYGKFVEIMEAAEAHDVTLLDPHGNWLERGRAAIAIHNERQHLIQDEDTRLADIDQALRTLQERSNHLVQRIADHNWSFADVLALYESYQQQLGSLKQVTAVSPTEQLAVFEQVAKPFLAKVAHNVGSLNQHTNLKAAKQARDEAANLLLEVFDLSPSERRQLFLDIQDYMKLTRERDLILIVQRNREQFLAKQHDE